MTTPITKEQELRAFITGFLTDPAHDEHSGNSMTAQVFRIALAAMDAEPVADVVAWHKEGEERTCDIRWRRFDVAPGPLFAVAQPVAVFPNEMTISDDMNLYQKSFAQGHNACRAAMLNHSEHERNMVQPVSQPYKLPSQSSDAVNEAAWKLHDTLTEHGPLNGHQFNNLKGCFYEALKVAMCNSPVIPDGWVACSERMPDRDYVLAADFSGKQYPANMPNIQIGIYADWFDDGCPCWDDGDGNDLHLKQVTHWTQIPAAPQQEGK